MTQTKRPASGQEAGREDEVVRSASEPNTADTFTQDIAHGPAKIINSTRDPMTGEIITQTWLTHGGLTVIDVNGRDASFFAAKFLPPTPVVLDRPNGPRSRWVYRSQVRPPKLKGVRS